MSKLRSATSTARAESRLWWGHGKLESSSRVLFSYPQHLTFLDYKNWRPGQVILNRPVSLLINKKASSRRRSKENLLSSLTGSNAGCDQGVGLTFLTMLTVLVTLIPGGQPFWRRGICEIQCENGHVLVCGTPVLEKSDCFSQSEQRI